MPRRFERLREKIERQYESKGVPETEARRISYATAYKVYHEHLAKKRYR